MNLDKPRVVSVGFVHVQIQLYGSHFSLYIYGFKEIFAFPGPGDQEGQREGQPRLEGTLRGPGGGWAAFFGQGPKRPGGFGSEFRDPSGKEAKRT